MSFGSVSDRTRLAGLIASRGFRNLLGRVYQNPLYRWRFGGAVAADTCIRVGTLQVEVPDRPGPLVLDLVLTGKGLGDEPIERTDRSRIVVG